LDVGLSDMQVAWYKKILVKDIYKTVVSRAARCTAIFSAEERPEGPRAFCRTSIMYTYRFLVHMKDRRSAPIGGLDISTGEAGYIMQILVPEMLY
jgi:hypothetical protein